MALVRQPTRVTFTFMDRHRKSTTGFYVGDSAGVVPPVTELANPNAAAPFSFVQEFYQSLQNASDAVGVGYSVTYSWTETPTLPVSGQPNVNEKGILTFQAGNTPSLFSIPALKDAALDTTGRKIARNGSTFIAGTTGDVATHLQSIHDKLQNGATINLANYPVTDAEGNDFTALNDAYLQTRASGRSG